MSTAIIGGTFDPPHIGHFHLAQEVYATGLFDSVTFIPTHIAAHKLDSAITDAKHRLAMLSRAVNEDFIAVDDVEIKRGGVTYTIDTIEEYRQRTGDTPGFVLGDDLLAGYNSWKQPQAIADKAQLIVAHRLFREQQKFCFRHLYLNNPLLDISSSNIRDRINQRKPFKYLVPLQVYKYIKQNNLYGFR